MAAIIALDVGDRRTGVARAPIDVAIASPLETIDSTVDFNATLQELLVREKATMLVIGLPRSIDGNDTQQTKKIRALGETLKEKLSVPIYFQDEAGTSLKAKEELANKKGTYPKEMIDALAATYILQDFLEGPYKQLKRDA